jgi:pyruvate dehydrogenase E1 component alpha subunit
MNQAVAPSGEDIAAPHPTSVEPGLSAGDGFIQLLTPEGERRDDPRYPLDVSTEQLLAMYRDMVIVRRLDAEGFALQRQGELGLWIPCYGQEAAQIGAAHALGPADVAFPSYRETGVAYCRGLGPADLLGFVRGTSFGGWDPSAHRFGLPTIVLGAQTLHATGYAMGIQRDHAAAAVITFFGDGASSQGDVSEAFIWAGVFAAPIVFFCQNNQWAISEPAERQSRIPLYRRADGFGFPGVRVDGNDVLAVLAVTRHALKLARSGGGPSLIEAFTYRMGPHTSSDDPSRYRVSADVEAWKLKDPIARVKAYAARNGLADTDYFTKVEAEAEHAATKLRETCLSMPTPEPTTIFDHVYAEPSPVLDEQRKALAEYLAGFEASER